VPLCTSVVSLSTPIVSQVPPKYPHSTHAPPPPPLGWVRPRTSVGARPHVVVVVAAAEAADDVDGAGGVDHGRVPGSANPLRAGRTARPGHACGQRARHRPMAPNANKHAQPLVRRSTTARREGPHSAAAHARVRNYTSVSNTHKREDEIRWRCTHARTRALTKARVHGHTRARSRTRTAPRAHTDGSPRSRAVAHVQGPSHPQTQNTNKRTYATTHARTRTRTPILTRPRAHTRVTGTRYAMNRCPAWYPARALPSTHSEPLNRHWRTERVVQCSTEFALSTPL
jgi:hypothetical protein